MNPRHAAVWIDHSEAKIFYVDAATFNETTVRAPHHHVRRHEVATAEKNHPADEQHFYHDVVAALRGAEEILVLGPSTAKLGFIKHVHKREAELEPRIVGVETVDHPTDGQLVAFVRRYFHAIDRLQGAVV
jgi:stalled ribosome rescue protein Dom34